MIDKIVGVFMMAFIITGLGITFRPGSVAPEFVRALLGGVANMQRASYGPR